MARNPTVFSPIESAGSRARARAVRELAGVFRAHGFEGASLAAITEATGLGKGSLYNFFPGGKAEMAAAVLAAEAAWFRDRVFVPLRHTPDPRLGIAHMLDMLEAHYRGGRQTCLTGVFTLGETRDRFADAVGGFFADWITALADALAFMGRHPAAARALAEDTVAQIEGALVLARARDDMAIFSEAVERLRRRLA